MVLEILKGSTEKPKYCVVEPVGPFDFTVRCDINKESVRRLIDMEKVCAIEIHKNGQVYSFCGSGKELVSRILA